MSFNRFKKQKNIFYNFVKQILFGKGIQEKKIIFGKAKGIRLNINPVYNFQKMAGTYEHEIPNLFVSFSKKCNYFFDIGSADGYYVLLYKKYNPTGEVYVFDADKNLKNLQNANFALNKVSGNIHSYFSYISDKNEWQNFINDLHIKNRSIFFKIDVEGAESIVLHGMNELLKENKCCFIIETHSAQLENDCINFLNNHNYTVHVIKNAWWRIFLAERRPLMHNRWIAAFT